jgi:hypothetical protein
METGFNEAPERMAKNLKDSSEHGVFTEKQPIRLH